MGVRWSGGPIAPPAVIKRIGSRSRRKIDAFGAAKGIPIRLRHEPNRPVWDDRKLHHVRPYFERAKRKGRFGRVAIAPASEFQRVFSAIKKTG